MSNDIMEHIRQDVETAALALRNESTPAAFAKQLASLIDRLEQSSVALLREDAGEPSMSEERLYSRALEDYAALQQQLAQVRSALSDRFQLIGTLAGNGHDLDSTRRHLAMMSALDQSLQHLIHLMQYDTSDRHEIDIRQGFQFISGSTNYGRFYFAPPKSNSGK